ncbi:unnamed protein product [Auanema sp. JU1783]|nr:unnamed protein product [Auanema sp. JU1783]
MKLLLVLFLAIVALNTIEARRNRFDRVDRNLRGDPCDVMCPRRDGWDRCEIVKERGETSVRCTDNRPDPPPSFGRGPVNPPYGGGRSPFVPPRG